MIHAAQHDKKESNNYSVFAIASGGEKNKKFRPYLAQPVRRAVAFLLCGNPKKKQKKKQKKGLDGANKESQVETFWVLPSPIFSPPPFSMPHASFE